MSCHDRRSEDQAAADRPDGRVRPRPGADLAGAVGRDHHDRWSSRPLSPSSSPRPRSASPCVRSPHNRDLASVAGIDAPSASAPMSGSSRALLQVLAASVRCRAGHVSTPNLGYQVLFSVFTTVVHRRHLAALLWRAPWRGFILGLARLELSSTWSGFARGLEPRFKPVLAFVALIGLLLYRPQGLFGKARIVA